MSRLLRTAEEIRAAGAEEAKSAPPLTEKQVDFVVALISPVFTDVWHLLDANAARQADAQRPAA